MSLEEIDYEIRPMRREDIPAVLDLRRETNLSEGTHSIDTWFEYDPEGFFVAENDEGAVIGACAGVLQHSDLAFVGLFVVRSDQRGRGIGRRIWARAMERVGGRNAGVNPVPHMLEKYRDDAGFPVQCDWCSVVCKTDQVPTSELPSELPGVDVARLTPDASSLLSGVSDYAAGVYGFSRGRLLSIMAAEEDCVTLAASRTDGGAVCGYGSVRHDIKGRAHLGPLIADDLGVAELLLRHLVESMEVAQKEGVTLMIVDCNREAAGMVERLGFETFEGTARLYRTEEVAVEFGKIFAQHNLNFSVF